MWLVKTIWQILSSCLAIFDDILGIFSYSFAMLLCWLRDLSIFIAIASLLRLSPASLSANSFPGIPIWLVIQLSQARPFCTLCISRQTTVKGTSGELSFISSFWIVCKAALKSLCIITAPFP